MAKLITCVVCGKQYEYCQNCDKDHNFWRTTYCSKNCKDIYNVCSKYAFGHINKDAAKKELAQLDISNLDNFHPSLQQNIRDILNTPVEKPKEIKTVQSDNDDKKKKYNYKKNK